MALTVGIDTYADFDYINRFINLDLNARSVWNSLTVEDKELYSRAAVQVIDKLNWIGEKSDENQPLKFPRAFKTYIDDPSRSINYNYIKNWTQNPFYKNSGKIFDDLKKSQCEIIIYLLTDGTDENQKKLMSLKKIGVSNFSVSSISFTFKDENDISNPLPDNAYDLIGIYLNDFSDTFRIERG